MANKWWVNADGECCPARGSLLVFKENEAICHTIDINQANTNIVTEFDSYFVCNSQSWLLLYCSDLDYH